MNILVVGSTGPLGREVVAQALSEGHVVRAFARDPSAPKPAPSLEVVRGDVFDQPSLDAAAHGQGAAVVILGIPFAALRKPTNVYSQGTRNLISALKGAKVRRLIVVSSFGVGDSRRDAGLLDRAFFSLFLRGAYADKELQEQAVREMQSRLHNRSPDPVYNGGGRRPLYCERRPRPGPFAGRASRCRSLYFGCAPDPRVLRQDRFARQVEHQPLRPRRAASCIVGLDATMGVRGCAGDVTSAGSTEPSRSPSGTPAFAGHQ